MTTATSNMFGDYFSEISKSISDAYDSATENTTSFFGKLGGTVDEAYDGVSKFFSEYWENLKRSTDTNFSVNARFTKEELLTIREWHKQNQILLTPLLMAIYGAVVTTMQIVSLPAAVPLFTAITTVAAMAYCCYCMGYAIEAYFREYSLDSSINVADVLTRWQMHKAKTQKKSDDVIDV